MTQRLKTVYFALETKTSTSTDNTDTTAPATTALTFESGAKTFVSVTAELSYDDIVTATGGTSVRRQLTLDFSPGGGASYSVNNTATIANTGENISFFHAFDFTAAFQTELGSTGAATVQWKLLVDQSTGTTLGVVNTCVLLKCTYWYDDTSSTQVKTVFFPLNAPVGALPTTAPTPAGCVIENHAGNLPEASVVILNRALILEGNENRAGSTTDFTITARCTAVVGGAVTDLVTGNHEGSLATDRCYRHVFNYTLTGAQELRLFATGVSRANHPQAYGFVTYSFALSGTTRVRECGILMSSYVGAIGDTGSLVSRAELVIPGANVTSKEIAFFVQFARQGSTTSPTIKVGTGTTATYTLQGSLQMAGPDMMMCRDDAGITLAQGRNVLEATITTGANTSFGHTGLNGWWLVSYDADVPASGVGASSRSICHQLETMAASSSHPDWLHSATCPSDTNDVPYYLSNQGIRHEDWDLYPAIIYNFSDAAGVARQCGYFYSLSNSGEIGRWPGAMAFRLNAVDDGTPLWPFKRWLGDERGACDLSDNPTFRRISESTAFGGSKGVYTYHAVWLTMHECADWAVAGTVYGAVSGTVDIALHLASTGERLLTTSRSGSGAWSLDWFAPDTVYVVVTDSAGRSGKSKAGTAGTDTFDVILGVPLGRAA